MNQTALQPSPILIASNSNAESQLVKRLLEDKFDQVHTSTHPDKATEDFDRVRPIVLVLAFGNLEQAERYNLGLFRQSQEIHLRPHRTIILCHTDEVGRAYELCRDEIFDDYAHFWPLAPDASRLLLAVQHALRDLAGRGDAGPGAMDLADHLRGVKDFESLLKESFARGDQHVASSVRAIAQAQQDIEMAIADFSRRMAQGDLAAMVEVRNPVALEQAFKDLKQQAVRTSLDAVAGTLQPLEQWANEVQNASAPHFASIRNFQEASGFGRPTVLVVDDDTFQHKVITRLLKDEGIHLVFTASGLEALNLLHKIRPELILMDISMPIMDGLEATRRIKGLAKFADIPIIMITANSEESVVTDCFLAGAIDFMVKPFFREVLLGKLAKILGVREVPKVEPQPGFDQTEFDQADL